MNIPQASADRFCGMLEILRWVLVGAGIWLGYASMSEASSASAAQAGLHRMVPLVVGGICGLTALEGLFLGAAAARRTGYVRSEYQVQSAMNNLALAGVALAAFFADWGPGADVALMSVALAFLILSSLNHFRGWLGSNRSLRGLTRPALTCLLVIAVLPVLLKAFP
ncbi:MAG: hypothetical protein P8J45_04545 [Phycisphaerales bacterium]|nr:hypothetical protein [Phycisphaerales bacterium]